MLSLSSYDRIAFFLQSARNNSGVTKVVSYLIRSVYEVSVKYFSFATYSDRDNGSLDG